MASDLYSSGLTFARARLRGALAGPNGLPMDTNIYQKNAPANSTERGLLRLAPITITVRIIIYHSRGTCSHDGRWYLIWSSSATGSHCQSQSYQDLKPWERTHIHTHTHTCIHMHTQTHTYTYTHMHTHTHTCIHKHTHMHTQTHTNTHTHTNTQTHTQFIKKGIFIVIY